jgi:hypothetical protein
LTYQEFCELCEERVKDIDPFDSIIQSVKERQRNRMNISGEDEIEP